MSMIGEVGGDAEFIAHVRKEPDGSWTTQPLSDHLRQTARLAGGFCAAFGNRDWGEILGFWHDLGKFLPAWQQHLRSSSGFEDSAFLEQGGGQVNHSSVGAVLAFDRLKAPPIARFLAYCIAGHHAGLPDWQPDEAGGDLAGRLFASPLDGILDRRELDRLSAIGQARPFMESALPRSAPTGLPDPAAAKGFSEQYHLWIRMLYSSLVDADFLDTEGFMEPAKTDARGQYSSLAELKARFDSYMARKQKVAADTAINRLRAQVLSACRAKAQLPSGFFSLNVPTGGGKTLSAMAFALEHAAIYGKRRIVMAIPYTSIIEQAAAVYSEAFEGAGVLEHHSNLDPEKETAGNRLAAENWDAPVIVTTNVQLFESLFASRNSACRKLHNLVGSVIVLDEAQMLPPEYLRPVLSALRGLVEWFGVTVVLCTATQPALEGRIGSPPNVFSGLDSVTPIIDDPMTLAADLRRAEYVFPSTGAEPVTWQELAGRLAGYEQVLCIVNTKRDCRELHALMPKGTLHLSAFMCPQERSEVIAGIRKRLEAGEPVRVVSTQLVEAGVDIDFPVVYRAMAGLDSIAQAAGRCNREGRLNAQGRLGEVVVFDPPRSSPPGLLRKGEDTCRAMLRLEPGLVPGPEAFTEYFQRFFSAVNDFDRARFVERLQSGAREVKFQFRTLARHFQLIDDEAQVGIFVQYGDGTAHLERLRRGHVDRRLIRLLQRYTVSIPRRIAAALLERGMVSEVEGFFIQEVPSLYRPGIGLDLEAELWPESLIL